MPHIGSCAPSTPHQMPPGGLGHSPSLSPCLHKRLETPTGTQRPPLRPFPAAYTEGERSQRRVMPGSFPCSRSTRVIPPCRRAPERYRSQLLGNSGGRACMSAPPWQGGRGRSPSRKSRFLEARDAAGALQAGGTASGKPGCAARGSGPQMSPRGAPVPTERRRPQRQALQPPAAWAPTPLCRWGCQGGVPRPRNGVTICPRASWDAQLPAPSSALTQLPPPDPKAAPEGQHQGTTEPIAVLSPPQNRG